jgi:hypothetical protein
MPKTTRNSKPPSPPITTPNQRSSDYHVEVEKHYYSVPHQLRQPHTAALTYARQTRLLGDKPHVLAVTNPHAVELERSQLIERWMSEPPRSKPL